MLIYNSLPEHVRGLSGYLRHVLRTLPRKVMAAAACISWCVAANAGDDDISAGGDPAYKVEMQTTFSDNKSPLWLNANRHGLSSLDKTNGYLRAAIVDRKSVV